MGSQKKKQIKYKIKYQKIFKRKEDSNITVKGRILFLKIISRIFCANFVNIPSKPTQICTFPGTNYFWYVSVSNASSYAKLELFKPCLF
jgi:hypothetical protein